MKNQGSDWEKLLRQTKERDKPASRTLFTEDMRQEVMQKVRRLEQKPHRRTGKARFHWLRVGISGLCLILIGGVFLSLIGSDGQRGLKGLEQMAASFFSGEKAHYAWNFQPLDARQKPPGAPIKEQDPDILPGLSNKYDPIQKSDTPLEVINEKDIEILEEAYVEGFGRLLYYKLSNGAVLPYTNTTLYEFTGFILDNSTNELINDSDSSNDGLPANEILTSGKEINGPVLQYGVSNLLTGSQHLTELFGEQVLKMELPICRTDGDACTFYIKQEGASVGTFAQFRAHSQEVDVDGDGKAEAIISTYKQNQIYVMRKKDDQLEWASIRDMLGAEDRDQIVFDQEQKLFSLTSDADGQTRSFAYSSKGLREVK